MNRKRTRISAVIAASEAALTSLLLLMLQMLLQVVVLLLLLVMLQHSGAEIFRRQNRISGRKFSVVGRRLEIFVGREKNSGSGLDTERQVEQVLVGLVASGARCRCGWRVVVCGDR